MKLGLCTTIAHARETKEWGYDYIEIPVRSYAELPIEEVRHMRKELDDLELSCKSGNFFYAAQHRLTGPSVDTDGIRAYIAGALERANLLGAKTLVVGCGPQRNAPMHFPRAEAVRQFGEHLLFAAETAEKYGIVLTIENIWDKETNILYSFRDCLELMRRLDHPNIRAMADFIHVRRQGDPLEDLLEAGENLVHVHIGNSFTAECPVSEDEDRYGEFLSILRKMNYRGNMTVETANLQNADQTAALLHRLSEDAGL